MTGRKITKFISILYKTLFFNLTCKYYTYLEHKAQLNIHCGTCDGPNEFLFPFIKNLRFDAVLLFTSVASYKKLNDAKLFPVF